MKTFGEMSDEEQGALLLANHRGEVIQLWTGRWRSLKGPSLFHNDVAYRKKPKEETATGKCWVYADCWDIPVFVNSKWSSDCVKGAYTVTKVDGKPTRIVWEADSQQ